MNVVEKGGFMAKYRKGFKELQKEGRRSLKECWEKRVFMAKYRTVFEDL